eukprot:CAMPEP_0119260384 /NCGR_PEP_ID=MMETSP1329-20130426/795_1 /TAXON_ID=114041 /ORGANISM="Genus nov. species nov., Strain RCC1024" /LENGTH=311 /DNA_ID=CAMNT_0007259807 /DNA_START=112 /DNA_END=1044 /DNA_ORIENTATION=+
MNTYSLLCLLLTVSVQAFAPRPYAKPSLACQTSADSLLEEASALRAEAALLEEQLAADRAARDAAWGEDEFEDAACVNEDEVASVLRTTLQLTSATLNGNKHAPSFATRAAPYFRVGWRFEAGGVAVLEDMPKLNALSSVDAAAGAGWRLRDTEGVLALLECWCKRGTGDERVTLETFAMPLEAARAAAADARDAQLKLNELEAGFAAARASYKALRKTAAKNVFGLLSAYRDVVKAQDHLSSSKFTLEQRIRMGRAVDPGLVVDLGGEPWAVAREGDFRIDSLEGPVPFDGQHFQALRDPWTLEGTFSAW